ncbi:hypothetical protein GUJ93_ZPchr0013g35532 [Zizania palustris]|uniref:Uncharacterized protein n=1 Tax=Zizania palustris TaxID=103762 RepID=A0A8J5WXD7_ZIZPA|nr:hypothetical protein GUJ93_ZPchr0013g35532 [Zizania palustris]
MTNEAENGTRPQVCPLAGRRLLRRLPLRRPGPSSPRARRSLGPPPEAHSLLLLAHLLLRVGAAVSFHTVGFQYPYFGSFRVKLRPGLPGRLGWVAATTAVTAFTLLR